jgi:hypothetical protein
MPRGPSASSGRALLLASRVLLILAVCLAFSGCILDRLWETHRQFYAQEPKILVKRHPRAPTRFVFLQPTLLAKDIEWLAGLKPTRVATKGGDRWDYYLVVQDGLPAPEKPSIEFRLRYVERDSDFRLAEVVLPQVGELLLTPELLAALVETVRKPETDLLRRQVKLDIQRFRELRLPGRPEVEKLLGKPNRGGPNDSVAVYRFGILGPDQILAAQDRMINVEFTYDREARIQRLNAAYLRYRVRANLEAGEAIIRID